MDISQFVDIEFILACGKVFSLVICMVFIEGVVASRKNADLYGLILPVLMLILSAWVIKTWHVMFYSLMTIIPAVICWIIYFVCRRSVKNGTALSLDNDEDDKDF